MTNWDAIAAVGQMIGSLGVFVTLGYLAVQVRHARLEARHARGQARAEALFDLSVQQLDERLNRIRVKADSALGLQPFPFEAALMERAGLTEEEAVLMHIAEATWWGHRLNVIATADQLSDIERTSFDVAIRFSYGNPGIAQLFYEMHIKNRGHPDAVRYVERVLAQPG
jgi:hypothetical protein